MKYLGTFAFYLTFYVCIASFLFSNQGLAHENNGKEEVTEAVGIDEENNWSVSVEISIENALDYAAALAGMSEITFSFEAQSDETIIFHISRRPEFKSHMSIKEFIQLIEMEAQLIKDTRESKNLNCNDNPYFFDQSSLKKAKNFDEIIDAFNCIKNANSSKFRYMSSGCGARAGLIAYCMRHKRISTAKVFIFGDFYPSSAFGSKKWSYHVANIVMNPEADSDKFCPIVIDAAHPKQFANVENWLKNLLGDKRNKISEEKINSDGTLFFPKGSYVLIYAPAEVSFHTKEYCPQGTLLRFTTLTTCPPSPLQVNFQEAGLTHGAQGNHRILQRD